MRLENVAIWTRDLDQLRAFYATYFGATAGPRYRNEHKRFESYFLTFPGGGRLELMQRPDIRPLPTTGPDRLADEYFGYAHFAVEVPTAAEVDALTERLRRDGHRVLDGPRTTGDHYYESQVADPEANRIVIVAA